MNSLKLLNRKNTGSLENKSARLILRMSYTEKNGAGLPFLIFTDLDDTLLDHNTYKWEKAEEALDYCIKAGIPVILVSSKTRAEIQVIHRAMNLDFPFISENGGGIFFPLSYEKDLTGREFCIWEGLIKITLGKPYSDLVEHLKEISADTGIKLKGFSQMSQKEVMDLTGLSEDQYAQALDREFDEPFIVAGPEGIDTAPLYESAVKRGLRISEGGRFFHLHGDSDKGRATDWLISFFKKQNGPVYSIALGDSPNDFGMFDVVNQPVLIKSARRFTDINIKERYPGIIITDKNGPEGWNEAVLGLLRTEREVLSDV